MQQRTTGGIEPVAAAVGTQPLYMGRLLNQLSHRTPHDNSFLTVIISLQAIMGTFQIKSGALLLLKLKFSKKKP